MTIHDDHGWLWADVGWTKKDGSSYMIVGIDLGEITSYIPQVNSELIIKLPKGGGAENMSRLAMLSPARGYQGVIDFVVNAVDEAGSNPCPPIIVGVGIGGTVDKTFMLAKRALLRKVGEPNPDSEVAELEKEILERVNKLGIGPMGYGGRTTALAVHAEVFPAHIASLPVAVNLQCWCARHKEATL